MLNEQYLNVVVAFASDNNPDAHIYGSAEIILSKDNKATAPINSVGESSTLYFISGDKICGHNCNTVSKIELTKTIHGTANKCHLLIDMHQSQLHEQ